MASSVWGEDESYYSGLSWGRHGIGVKIIIRHRRIFVRAGDFIDAIHAIFSFREMPDICPDTRRFKEHFRAIFAHELPITRRIEILVGGVSDGGIDVILRCTCWEEG